MQFGRHPRRDGEGELMGTDLDNMADADLQKMIDVEKFYTDGLTQWRADLARRELERRRQRWQPENRRNLKVEMSQEPSTIMSAEQSRSWNAWFVTNFKRHLDPALQELRDDIRKAFDDLVDEAGALTAEIRHDLEMKIAKLEAGTARTFNVRSTFDPQATYSALDVVTLNGTWFVARHDNPGPCPGSGWQAGPVGKRGQPGVKIRRWRLDVPNYTATPVMSDGGEAPAIDLRPFFEQYDQEKNS
jgi:hypothetical protein